MNFKKKSISQLERIFIFIIYVYTLKCRSPGDHSENAHPKTTTRRAVIVLSQRGAQLEHIEDRDRQSYQLFYSTISVDSMQSYAPYIRLVRRHEPMVLWVRYLSSSLVLGAQKVVLHPQRAMSPLILASLYRQRLDAARRVFTDQEGIPCTKRDTAVGCSASAMEGVRGRGEGGGT